MMVRSAISSSLGYFYPFRLKGSFTFSLSSFPLLLLSLLLLSSFPVSVVGQSGNPPSPRPPSSGSSALPEGAFNLQTYINSFKLRNATGTEVSSLPPSFPHPFSLFLLILFLTCVSLHPRRMLRNPVNTSRPPKLEMAPLPGIAQLAHSAYSQIPLNPAPQASSALQIQLSPFTAARVTIAPLQVF